MNKTLLDLSALLPHLIDEATIRSFIVERISKTQYRAWCIIKENPDCSSTFVAKSLKIKANHARNTLLDLVRLNLVEQVYKYGVYKYKIKEQDNAIDKNSNK